MTSQQIRQRFLTFFANRGHAVIPSASLVPENDPTVLFTTAGMHPLVPYLLGEAHPSGSKRLTSAQKCVRTDDIDEVGDNRHLTFFEMLGNWSLGDYFKEEAIGWSWQLLTDKAEGFGLDPSRLYITVFAGDSDAPEDQESIRLWKECFSEAGITAGVDLPLAESGRIFRMPKNSNWWGPAGQSGPCGPDTEMYYDTGEGTLAYADGMPDFDSGRLVEIWNDVFMQYSKDPDGHFAPLVQKNVDTGMGLERFAMVMQNVSTVFETDLFQPILAALPATTPEAARIMADHLRASVFLICDGVRPSNKERGYILRRLLRRSLLHADLADTEWVGSVVRAISSTYGDAYPLESQQEQVITVITDEATKFLKTLTQGRREIEKRSSLSGKEAFDLYQSYGFPLELTAEYARSKGVAIDQAEFEREFRLHQDLSRSASAGQFKSGLADSSEASTKLHTATHLLHAALRQILGNDVRQMGSNITPERLRFDFAYPTKLTPEQLRDVEGLINEEIQAALPVSCETMPPDTALAEGALGFFGHKYGDSVTVYGMGEFSREICTGPHVGNTSDVGMFKILKEEAVSAGVRRIKATVS